MRLELKGCFVARNTSNRGGSRPDEMTGVSIAVKLSYVGNESKVKMKAEKQD